VFGSDTDAFTNPYLTNILPGDTWRYAYEEYANTKPKFDSENYIFFVDFYEEKDERERHTMLEFKTPVIHDWDTYEDEISISFEGKDYYKVLEFASIEVIESEKKYNNLYTTYYISLKVDEVKVLSEHAGFYQWDVVLVDDFLRTIHLDNGKNEYEDSIYFFDQNVD
jgi:hypothetical protein